MATTPSPRLFSTEKHLQGKWNTRVVSSRSRLLRAVLSYCSYKRDYVDKLAKGGDGLHFVLDAGCGTGAYSFWFLARRPSAVCIAVDWSEAALRGVRQPPQGRILRVCADVRRLPFRSESFDGLFSIDTLGHVDDCPAALDEFFRVLRSGSPLFLHSECRDYQNRWPDKALMKRLGEDVLAKYDGHGFLKSSEELYTLYSRRFRMHSFINPAGYLGSILGYPEKYRMAFIRARWRFMALSALVFAGIKRAPLLGGMLRLVNALTNRCEVFFGLKGGGSCFGLMRKH
jgi:ubiquinone/menaquinone biosynthesis C-methylase UbiE